MSVPRINLKSIDYFKFKKLVIDGIRDDYPSCSKEVKALCDSVQTLHFRDEEFDDESDRDRFSEICGYYRQILQSKRIDPTDMRIKSGWWGDHKNAYSAGKLKAGALKDTLVAKAKQWTERHGGNLSKLSDSALVSKLDGPGLYVLKHKDQQCFQYVGRADKVFARVAEKLKAAFEGNVQEPLAALLVIGMMSDWEFYFIPVQENDDEKVLHVLENDLILKHDSIWPHGLNFCLHIDSLLEVSEFRKSCLRHHWPPECDAVDGALDITKLRTQIAALPKTSTEASGKAEGEVVAKASARTEKAKAEEQPTGGGKAAKVDAPKSPAKQTRPTSAKAPAKLPLAKPQSKAPPPAPTRQSPPSPPPPVRSPTPEPEDQEIAEIVDSGDGFMFSEDQLPERPSSARSTGTYVLDSSASDSESTNRPDVTEDKTSRPRSANKKVSGILTRSPEKPRPPKDGPTTPRRGKPTTPQNSSKRGSAGESENEPWSPDSDEPRQIVRSVSGTSLSSSVDERCQILPDRKSPAPKGSKARPNSAKTRQDKSRLPVAASGPLRHQNRE